MKKESDIVHGAFHISLDKEINRVLLDCEKYGIFLNKKLVTALIAEKSKRGKMNVGEIRSYIKRIKGMAENGDDIKDDE